MPTDKQTLREALAQYRAWNEADLMERLQNAGKRSPAKRWHDHQELVSFCWTVEPQASAREQQLRIEEWDAYYTSLRRFEMEQARRARRNSCRP